MIGIGFLNRIPLNVRCLLLFQLLITVIFVQQLAPAAQNPDGMELVMTAVQGGNLHPPGYPLQNWFNRAWLAIFPFENAAYGLSCLNLVLHFFAMTFLVFFLQQLQFTTPALLTGICFYNFNPVVWSLAVQPEKYALFHLLFLLLLYFLVVPKFKNIWMIGLTLGLAIAHHPFVILVLPWLIYRASIEKAPWLWSAKVFIVATSIAILLYLSLFWLKGEGVWPDWGLIQSMSDWWNLISRADFKGGQPSTSLVGDTWTGDFAWKDYWLTYSALGLLPLAGLVALCLRKRWFLLMTSLGSAAIAVLLLYGVKYISAPGTEAYMERYSLAFYLPLIVPCAFIVQFLHDQFRIKRQMMLLTYLLPLALLLQLGINGWNRADLSKNRTLDLFLEGISVLLDPQDLYIAGTDIEIFAGVPYFDENHLEANRRFPMLLDYTWVVPRQYQVVESRFSLALQRGIRGIKNWSEKDILNVISTHQKQVEDLLQSPSQIYGLVYRVGPGLQAGITADAFRAAVKLCPVIKKLQPISSEGHFYSRHLLDWFYMAYYSANLYLINKGLSESIIASQFLAQQFKEQDIRPSEITAACEILTRDAAVLK